MERFCGKCKKCVSAPFSEALKYTSGAMQLFGEEKAEEILSYIQATRNSGGGRRICSAPPPPFVYPDQICNAKNPEDFESRV